MLLTVDELVTLVRSSVNVQVPVTNGEGEVVEIEDEGYLTMTDDDIKLFIKLGVTRAFPDVEDLEDLPNGSEFAVVLLAKIELYTKLAVLNAYDVDLGADNNNYIKQDQRFSHYMKLVDSATKQYEDWLDNESAGNNTITTYDVLLSNRHYTHRNYEKQIVPKVKIKIDNIFSDGVEIQWKISGTSHFGSYKVYISTERIINQYNEGAKYTDKISENAECVKSTHNIRDSYLTLKDLEADTIYYIAVVSVERNQVFGFAETSFTTLEAED